MYGLRLQELAGDQNGALVFCGISGWYLRLGHVRYDTDWFEAIVGPTGVVEVTVLSELTTIMALMGPHDCGQIHMLQNGHGFRCEESTMTIVEEPGTAIWLRVYPSGVEEPPYTPFEYSYRLEITGLEPVQVATQRATWGGIKSLYKE